MNSTTKYFCTLDHLASVREMGDNSGVIQAQYNFDPFGRLSKNSEAVPSDFGYGGFYSHSRAWLNLATFRSYSSTLGRWISRDPMEEVAGINVFVYANNSPSTVVDAFGLDGQGTAGATGQSGSFAGGYGGVGVTGGAGYDPGPSAATQTGAAGGGQVQHFTYPNPQLNTRCNLRDTNLTPTSNPPRGLQATPLLGDWPSTSTGTSATATSRGNSANASGSGRGVGLDVGGIVLPKTGK